MMIYLTRRKLYPVVARRGPAWRWMYSYRINTNDAIDYGVGLSSLRNMLKHRFPQHDIVQSW